MPNGYAGKIARINLTTKQISTLDTEKYIEYAGGHGIASAIFWDLAVAPGQWDLKDSFNPKNVITITSGPFAGVVVSAASGRCEVTGLGPQGYPTQWYTRSNFGGRFSQQLRYAGWDGVVIEGAIPASDNPVWINIINDKVVIEDAKSLWGMDVLETQQEIWRRVTGNSTFGEWMEVGNAYSTQKPAVLCIGPSGEILSKIGALVHDSGSGAGQGGFGGVWGGKKLKAISVIGTGSATVADPKALMEARLWYRQFQYDVDSGGKIPGAFVSSPINNMGAGDTFWNMSAPYTPARPQGCAGCTKACRQRLADGLGNESSCEDTIWANSVSGTRKDKARMNDLGQHYGINLYQPRFMLNYLKKLWDNKIIGTVGSGAPIESDLPFHLYPKADFVQMMLRKMVTREEPLGVLADGCAEFAAKFGRYEQDTGTGWLPFPFWGYHQHYTPQTEVEWSYGSIMGERDINEHSFNFAVQHQANKGVATAEELANILAATTKPYTGDPLMFDYSKPNVYSAHWAKTVAWHRHYTRFFIQTCNFCDWVWPTFISPNSPDKKGATYYGGEVKFYNAVTGRNITFEQGMETGRKIWNLDKAIWVLQGRHRNQEVFQGYVYDVGASGTLPAIGPDGKWAYIAKSGEKIDRQGFEEWKTHFFNLEGWNPNNGWPTRATLEGVGLKNVADKLQSAGKLG